LGLLFDCGVEVPLAALCLRCCSANCSRATCDGSFNERKLSTECALFFFFLDDAESFEDDALDDREARLEDVELVVSREG
jgi:hypothetical protein